MVRFVVRIFLLMVFLVQLSLEAYRDACRASHYLGYSNEETEGKSWYSYVHPDDLPDIAYKHRVCMYQVLSLFHARAFILESHTVYKSGCCGNSVSHFETEALSLQGNAWIYGIRDEFVAPRIDACSKGCKSGRLELATAHLPPVLVSLLAAIKKEPDITEAGDLRCPDRHFKDFNNNSRGPMESTKKYAELNFGNDDEDSELEALPELCLEQNIKGPLPDLRDDLDDFFDEVDHPKTSLLKSPSTKLHENMKCAENTDCSNDLSVPPLPLDSVLRPREKIPTIAKLLHGHFDVRENYRSIQKRSRFEQLGSSSDTEPST
ncbi:unnamed protein product [Gongylonema pulchrum]|uniref:PAS domain-containing protein n=1 Tax=Gongylonema pulchrum TaxID=637853 RepID=A0A183DQW3_9BILA|nr:unnamed protein product [Gongylonema pulchrum]